MRNPLLRTARVLTCILPILFAGCFGEDEEPLSPESGLISVILENKDQLPAHLFVTDQFETFPCCQVAANDQRSVSVNTQSGWEIAVSAGRNGQVLSSKSCKVTVDHIARHFLTATFTGSGWQCKAA